MVEREVELEGEEGNRKGGKGRERVKSFVTLLSLLARLQESTTSDSCHLGLLKGWQCQMTTVE